ncbi:MAG: tetratricopeptide repeat protein [Bacteroidales bacterium]|nr:tetratricopeptide repeat protein [Bacteroidales bacterium]
MIKTRFNCTLIIILLSGLLAGTVQAQQTVYFDNPDQMYREAVELFDNDLFDAAQQKFAGLQQLLSDKQSMYYVDAAYYDVVCAIELNQADASEKVKTFADTYRSSRWMPKITLLQARVLFNENNYQQALNAFKKVSPAGLSRGERNEYFFKTGYAQMRTNDADRALVNFGKVKEEKSIYQVPATYYYAHLQYTKGKYDEALKHFKRLENDRTYSKLMPVYIMQIYYQTGEYDKVIAMGDQVMNTADSKRKADIAQMMAESYYKRENYAKALEYYTIFEQSSRRQLSRDDQYQVALTKFKMGKYKEAINNFQQAVGKDDALTQGAYYHLGRCYYETDQANFARNAFLSASKSTADPQLSEDALFNYARLSIEAGADPYNEAVTALEKFIAANPNSNRKSEASGYVVQLYLNSRNYDAALGSLEKVRNRSKELKAIYAQLAYSRGIELFNRGDFKGAIGFFEKAINEKADGTSTATATFWLADAWYREKNYANAQRYFKDFLSMREATKLDVYPLASYNLGYAYFSEKQYASALPWFRQYVNAPYSKQPRLTNDAWLRLGDIQFIGRQYTEAANAYDQVIRARQPESDYAYFQKAQCYGALGNFSQKVSTLNELVRAYPKSAYYDNALYEMGSTSLVMNDPKTAIIHFDKLVKERPRSAYAKEALVKMGLIYYNNNQNDRAITTLKKVVEDYPGTDESRESMNTLKSIYMEMNRLQDFFAYAEKSGAVQYSGIEQDSLAFTMAENFYQENRFADALTALTNYLNKYPKGAYMLPANFYKARIELNDKQLDAALANFRVVIDFPDNQYTDEALLESARIMYEREDYPKAHEYYTRLYSLADEPNVQVEALEGKMKSSYFLKRYDEAVQEARLLKSDERTGKQQLLQASFILGKSLFEQRNFAEASTELDIVVKQSKNALGAEALYMKALISYENAAYDEAEKLAFDLADKFGAYDYWVAKGFILLADVYVKKNNVFQAKQTLQSIIDNYKGDDLRNVAAQKLASLGK